MKLERLGNRVVWARTQRGWTAADLIRESSVPQGTISKIEKLNQDSVGKYGLQLQKALGVSLEWLITGAGNPYAGRAPSKVKSGDIVQGPVSKDEGEQDYVYVQSFEFWNGDVDSEIRFMNVPVKLMEAAGITAQQVKSIEMPDNSGEDRIMQGDELAINIDWDGRFKSNTVYAVLIGGAYTLRRVIVQASGKLVLSCRNKDYPDDVIEKADIPNLVVLGSFLHFRGSSA